MSDVTAQRPLLHQEDELGLGRIFGILLDHKWWIVGVTLVFTLLGVVHATLATPVYQGDALVQVERRSSVSPLGDLADVFGQDTQSTTSAEVQILQSRMVLSQVVDRVGLDVVVVPKQLSLIGEYIQRKGIARPSFMQGKESVWGGEFINVGLFDVTDEWRGVSFTIKAKSEGHYALWRGESQLGEGAVGEVERFLDGAVQLRVAELNAAIGAVFSITRLNRVQAANRLKGRLNVSEVGGGGQAGTGILRLTLTGPVREEIRRSLDAVAETFLTQNVERQSAQAEQSLAFLEEQTPELRAQLSEAENRLNEYRVAADSIDLDSEAQSVVTRYIDLEQRLNELEFQEAELAQRFTSSHPTYQALLRQKRQVQNDLAELNERVSQLPAAQQEVVRMTRDVEVTQAIYVNVLNKTQELQMARAGTVGNVRIIDKAQVGGAIAPRKSLIVMLATLLGGMLAVGGVLIIAFMRRGIETPEQIEQSGLPVYATVPLSSAQLKLVRGIKKKSKRKVFNVTSDVLAERDPGDIAIESIRGLRTSLHFAMLEAKNHCLMITGSGSEVGKSFISVNLGAVCAQSGQRVLVIDADMRKGHLHYPFGGESANGLSDVLSGLSTWQKQLRSTKVQGLSYISRGMAPPNPSELLMGPRFKKMLDEMQEHFDLIIVDTPPVLAVTDPAIVGNHCGTTLLVARFEVNSIKEIQLAIRRLESAGVIVKGAILNAVERKAATEYGYGYYHYSYKSMNE